MSKSKVLVSSRDVPRQFFPPKNTYQLIFKGKPENIGPLSKILDSFNIPKGRSSGKRYNSSIQDEIGYLTANEIPEPDIKVMKSKLYEFLKNLDAPQEWLILALHENPNKFSIHLELNSEVGLRKFLKKPRMVIFPKVSKILAGVKACLQNALDLLSSASLLLKNEQKNHAAFLLITAFEEIGKALLLIDSGKEAKSLQTAMVDGWRAHEAKLWKVTDWLTGMLVKDPCRNAYRRERGALQGLIDKLSEVDFRQASKFSDTDLLITLENLGQIHREYSLFVEHNGIDLDWSFPRIQWKREVLDAMCDLAKIICEAFLKKIERAISVLDIPDFKDLSNQLPKDTL